MKIFELFAPDAKSPIDVKWERDGNYTFARFQLDGDDIRVRIVELKSANPYSQIDVKPGPGYDVEFDVNLSQTQTGSWGTQSVRVIGAVVSVLQKWFSSHPWSWIVFSGTGLPGAEHRSRVGLYRKMSQLLARRAGAELYEKPYTGRSQGTSVFVIYKPADSTEVSEAKVPQWRQPGRPSGPDTDTGKLAAYHGTMTDFQTFLPLTHFGSLDAAQSRLAHHAKSAAKSAKSAKIVATGPSAQGKIYKVELDIKHPALIRDLKGVSHGPTLLAFALKDAKVITREQMLSVTSVPYGLDGVARGKALIQLLTSMGYDGIVYKNRVEDPGHMSWIILRSDQAHVVEVMPVEKGGNRIDELFKFGSVNPADYKWEVRDRGHGYAVYNFTVGGQNYRLAADKLSKLDIYNVEFGLYRGDHMVWDVSSTGNASIVFALAAECIRDLCAHHNVKGVWFSAKESSRKKLYAVMIKMIAQQKGWQVRPDLAAVVAHTHEQPFLAIDPAYATEIEPILIGNRISREDRDIDEAAGVGLVVPGVNMPAGQHPDEIRRQAIKFGNRVSRHGVPPAIRPDGVFEDSDDMSEITKFLETLSADDVGTEEIGNYTVHYEGFGDWCQSDAEERCSLPPEDPRHLANYNDVYDEVLKDFVQREDGKQPIESGSVGTEEYPVFYAVFEKHTLEERMLHLMNQHLQEEVWDKPNPRKKHQKLSAKQRAAARARANRAGRKYPNLIDNMWATKR